MGGRWRVIAHTAAPAHIDPDAILVGLLTQLAETDPEMLAEMGAAGADIPTLVAAWPRLVAKTTAARRMVVMAGSRRQRRRLENAALRAGWVVVGGSADECDAVALSRLALAPETAAILLGADRSPGGDEKRHLPELAALVAAVTRSRPEVAVVLAGGAAAYEAVFATVDAAPPSRPAHTREAAIAAPAVSVAAVSEIVSPLDKEAGQSKLVRAGSASAGVELPRDLESVDSAETVASESAGDPADWSSEDAPTVDESAIAGPAPEDGAPHPPDQHEGAVSAVADQITEDDSDTPHMVLAPDAEAGEPAGSSLQQVLEGLRVLPNDSRSGIVRSIETLAYVLDRSIEVVEIGLQGGLWARSEPSGQDRYAISTAQTCLAGASFAPESPSEEVIDGVLAWSTTVLDRHRAMDRLVDLRLMPWGEADGDGALFRLAAAKAACGRLTDATPGLNDQPLPELLVAAGGVFCMLPPSVVALTLADLVRRPGVSHLAIDQARILGPLGTIENEAERRRLMADLADDILMPLGSLILPAGIKPGRSAGRLRLRNGESTSEIELHPGSVQVIDLPPGRTGRADLEFRDAVRLPKRAHHFSIEVGGGLGGLLVDLREIPMRISDRPDSRRAALEAWQRGMWPESDE